MAKKKKQEVDPQGWMFSFSDLLTNMLTFFVLLYSLGSMNNLELEYSLGPSLGAALGVIEKGSLTSIGKPKFISVAMLPTEEFALIEDAVIRALLTKNKEDYPDELISYSQNLSSIEVYSNNKFAQILFPARLIFEKNSYEITPRIAKQLESIGKVLEKFAHPIRVNGYSHSSQTNDQAIELSLRRAAAILNFLTSKGGLSPDRCSLAGYGYLKNKDSQYKDKNEDYVEIFIIKATNYSI